VTAGLSAIARAIAFVPSLNAGCSNHPTGGGAFLAYVEGKPFASLAQIDDR
jgi:hypothetical protein